MGAVFEATHTLIGKKVAVKVLLDKYARRDAIVARLEQEARMASSIGHEHIIDITDFGQTEDGRTFVVMEFLEGESLSELLNREGPLPEQRIVDIARQIASALGAAHAKGIVHRDLKPDNIFLVSRGSDKDFVKILDFGIAKVTNDAGSKLTKAGAVFGTPHYMSPEQARGSRDVDARSDQYALGVIAYECATGQRPFDADALFVLLKRVVEGDARPPRALRSCGSAGAGLVAHLGAAEQAHQLVVVVVCHRADRLHQVAHLARVEVAHRALAHGHHAVVVQPEGDRA